MAKEEVLASLAMDWNSLPKQRLSFQTAQKAEGDKYYVWNGRDRKNFIICTDEFDPDIIIFADKWLQALVEFVLANKGEVETLRATVAEQYGKLVECTKLYTDICNADAGDIFVLEGIQKRIKELKL